MLKDKVRVKTFKIDDIDVTGRSDSTILEVANEHGIKIPTLCYLEGLSSVGSCRMCLVEIKGNKNLIPACTSKIKEGMEVITNSEKLKTHRKMVLSMIFAERTHTCSVCVSNGHCELQNQAIELELEHSFVPHIHKHFEVDASHKDYIYDPNRCILCSRCVRVCDEVEGAHALDIAGRGIDSKIIHDMDEPWALSESCTSCGKCVQVCPTGSLFEKGLSATEMVKKKNIVTNLIQARRNK
ncbi:bidirectional hydrogenase complex protein HoxU [Halarcobacter anaerophilus]|uniref:Bidirectional hydrogenase complex protein HoxU n=1 Tax=Halarcobacter anaerophilus TaxID=877500 RepID=A0A4Q0XX94_9BACT|nr:bidirectional hydrogenase complex protein HoxU [Halarcobacter anaerophilus]QDF30154.1 bidirectional [Ni-Fe] hydrogenase complex, diaphorase protein HoxU [Halarcobacter anaerophilus]RXJ62280.1 bidirectional hydrogenase complex protein HoxU [Halarcobacter anaerophilus]